jgi:hypothetical protein
VHSPYTPAERHKKDYADIEVPTPADIFPPRPGKPDWAQAVDFWKKADDGTPMWSNRSLASWVRQYHQGVLAIDEGVSKVLQALEKSGQRENTLIIFTSDQGFAWGQHGFRHKVAAYDSNIRSPLIISFPGQIPQGAVCPTPVAGVDLVPTIFQFAGIKVPWTMHGRDLTPLLKDPKADWPHPVLLSATGQSFGSDTNPIPKGEAAFHSVAPWYVMLRQGRFKYVRPLIENDLEELYDLKADPEELHNLAVKPDFQSRGPAPGTSPIAVSPRRATPTIRIRPSKTAPRAPIRSGPPTGPHIFVRRSALAERVQTRPQGTRPPSACSRRCRATTIAIPTPIAKMANCAWATSACSTPRPIARSAATMANFAPTG